MSKLAKTLQAAAGNAGGDNLYVEDVFSTYLYEGTGLDGNTAQTITNGIDLDGEGGLVWIQERNDGSNSYSYVADSERGSTKYLITQVTNAEGTQADAVTSFNSDGFTLGVDSIGRVNVATGSPLTGRKYASWTFRKAPKFFDVVTYTGTGSATTIPHNLGSVPGCIIVKSTTYALGWPVYHRSLGQYTNTLYLNDISEAGGSKWNEQLPTDSSFPISANDYVNKTGETYVAYLFAHDAGGFGDDGEQNVISCGSYTGNVESPPVIDLGFEPQWLMVKHSAGADNWYIINNMTGMVVGGADNYLFANTSNAELTGAVALNPLATGFQPIGGNINSSGTYIYIAIRRGPMKTPTSGTEVFSPNAVSTDASPVTTNFPVDLILESPRTGAANIFDQDRLRGVNKVLYTYGADAESTAGGSDTTFQNNTSVTPNIYGSGTSLILWNFRRAPGFFDVVAYTGTGSATTQAHNLGVAPQLLIIKPRSASNNWWVLDVSSATARVLNLDLAFDAAGATYFGDNTVYVAPTSSVFSIGSNGGVNGSGVTYVAYLFASCPGVSKVGSYTGTGADLNVDCGFSAGARFILIKRTDSTGDWYVWDSARGIVAGNDPYLLLNSTAAEEPNTDYIDPLSSGFTVTSNASSTVNVDTGTYIFLAIA
jgi:hypothetical protein